MANGDDVCKHHEGLVQNIKSIAEQQTLIYDTCADINDKLSNGKVKMAVTDSTVSILKAIIFGGIALVLAAVVAAVLALVLR